MPRITRGDLTDAASMVVSSGVPTIAAGGFESASWIERGVAAFESFVGVLNQSGVIGKVSEHMKQPTGPSGEQIFEDLIGLLKQFDEGLSLGDALQKVQASKTLIIPFIEQRLAEVRKN